MQAIPNSLEDESKVNMTHTTDDPKRVEFWRSLLKIDVPVSVTLAQQQLPIERILKFVPGVMIQFDKACDTPLALEIDGVKIAEGEVVKVGDKFGLRLTEIAHPIQRWIPLIQSSPTAVAAK